MLEIQTLKFQKSIDCFLPIKPLDTNKNKKW